jgi:uncharacterized membrane protein
VDATEYDLLARLLFLFGTLVWLSLQLGGRTFLASVVAGVFGLLVGSLELVATYKELYTDA